MEYFQTLFFHGNGLDRLILYLNFFLLFIWMIFDHLIERLTLRKLKIAFSVLEVLKHWVFMGFLLAFIKLNGADVQVILLIWLKQHFKLINCLMV